MRAHSNSGSDATSPCHEQPDCDVLPARMAASVYLLALGAFALGMASYITAGLIPLLEAAFAVPVAMAAQLVTVFALAYGLGAPIVVARLPGGHQRGGLLGALGLFVAANAASALADSFAWLLGFRALAGVGAGVYLALGIAAATALSAPSRRGRAIAIIMGGMAAGTVLGVPLGLLLAERLGWTAALWLVAALGLAALAGLAWRLPALPASATPAPTVKATVPQPRKRTLLADREVVVVLSVSLLAALASLGLYTFLAPLLAAAEYGGVSSIAPWLWVWGLGGIAGSMLAGPLTDRLRGPVLTLAILSVLALALLSVPLAARWHPGLAMLPIAIWGAAGWALQVPQNDALIRRREPHGDGHLAVALNESALYLGSAIGAAGGGLLLAWHWPVGHLALAAAALTALAALGAWLQRATVRRSHLD